MTLNIYRNLSWLPPTPEDFASLCSSVFDRPGDAGALLRHLADHALSDRQLAQLAAILARARTTGLSLNPLIPFRLGMLSSSTADFSTSAIVGSALRHGVALECVKAEYGTVAQEALSANSRFHGEKLDAVLIALDYRSLPLRAELGSRAAAEVCVHNALQYLETVRAGLRNSGVPVCMIQTLVPPPERLFGSLDRRLPGSLMTSIESINRGIQDGIAASGDILFDVAGLAEIVGLADWHSATAWNLAKLPFSNSYLPLYADHVARLIAALRGKSRKALVLDLDNTVWGGVIGDDGLEGIRCAEGDPQGEAHRSLQRYALDLRDRGILLAVCSKNSDDVARRAFRDHPEMLLREEHIAVFQANWNDKATNLKAIAQDLSLGLDSLVLLDDDPNERHLVRQFLPSVAVPELPSDPALFARTLSAAGYFESISFSNEDSDRARHYQENAHRLDLQKTSLDLDGYLASLKMEITFQPFNAAGRQRIVQLINKSNQYNLTTKRYTEADALAAESDSERFTLQVRLSDAVGDSGMISVVICERQERNWYIDTWLMSCRVLGRRVEWMVLRELLEQARERGIAKLVGVYIPTERNKLAADHFSKLGFRESSTNSQGVSVWEMDVATATLPSAPMLVRRSGFRPQFQVLESL